jgi:flagellar biosynthesis protein FlhA
MVSALVMFVLALAPGLPLLPFALLGSTMSFIAYVIPKRRAELVAAEEAKARATTQVAEEEARQSIKESLKTVEIELCLGKQISASFVKTHNELAQRVAKMRRKFAKQYGFVVPEIRLSDDLAIRAKTDQIKIHGTMVAGEDLRIGDVLVITGDGPRPDFPCDDAREPAFGMKAVWVSETYASELKREGFKPIDAMSVLLTHLREVIRNNLAQMLSYRDVRLLLDRLEPEYKRLLEEIAPSQVSYSGIQAVLKLLLAERISIRNLHLILEAIAEIAPHVRRAEQLAEHVRVRLAQQICGDLSDGGVLKVLRLGNRWDLAFHQALKRDAKGDVVEFDIDPRLIEQFSTEASKAIRGNMDQGHQFVLVAAPDARPYVRMVMERLFATLPVLSHVEIARGVQIKSLGSIS